VRRQPPLSRSKAAVPFSESRQEAESPALRIPLSCGIPKGGTKAGDAENAQNQTPRSSERFCFVSIRPEHGVLPAPSPSDGLSRSNAVVALSDPAKKRNARAGNAKNAQEPKKNPHRSPLIDYRNGLVIVIWVSFFSWHATCSFSGRKRHNVQTSRSLN
jgi:hypothetical protein